MSLKVDGIDHLVLNVSDVERSAAWYSRNLGMDRIDSESRTGPRVAMVFATQKINLRPANADPKEWFTGVAPVPGSADLCFVTKLTAEAVKTHWIANGVAIEKGPVPRKGARGAMTSVYCRDPDGNLIEVSTYLAE